MVGVFELLGLFLIIDFVVDLDNIWEWLGFNQKYAAKRLLEKYFILDNDYKILLPPQC